MNKNMNIALLGLMMIGLSACGKGSATASLSFNNQTPASTAKTISALTDSGVSASVFKMKMIAAYLAEDIDPVTENNVGNSQMIWMNPECAEDIMHCNISAGTAQDGAPWSHIVGTFFDFSNSQSVNVALNSQPRKVDAGQYRYVRLEFCKSNPQGVDNVQWQSDEAGVNSLQSFRIDQCVSNSVVLNPPLDVKENNSVSISLGYSLSNLVEQRNSGGSNCSNGYCFELPKFSPTASVR